MPRSKMIPRVQRAIEAGIDPASFEAQEVAGEWMELLEQFRRRQRGTSGLAVPHAGAQEDNTDYIQQHGDPSPRQIEFIERANAACS